MTNPSTSVKLQPDGTHAPASGSGQNTGADPGPGQASSGNTRVSSGNDAKPRLPHERDESSDSQVDKAPADDGRARQAHKDAASGAVDTGKSAVTDKTYQRVKHS